MGPVYRLFAEYPLLSLAQTALTIWMLVDAYRRHAEAFWFWIILLIQPFGAWAYFFVVKFGDFKGAHAWPVFQRPASLAELRYQAEKVPTLASHLALANRLIEKNLHEEAMPHLEAALAREPEHCQVLHGLAVCEVELGHPEKALPYLERIVVRDPRWSDYAAQRLLVRARTEVGDGAGALAAARELVRLAPTLHHQCLLAECLVAEGFHDEARTSLQQSLETHRYAPSLSRRRNRSWARQARRLQKRIPAG
jgi:hypothetical protein